MVRFMDWSVVAMGCALILGGLGSRWWERTRVGQNDHPDNGLRFFSAWFPLLAGLGMICANVPRLFRAPYSVVEVFDALNFGLAVTTLGFVLRLGRRFFRARGTT